MSLELEEIPKAEPCGAPSFVLGVLEGTRKQTGKAAEKAQEGDVES